MWSENVVYARLMDKTLNSLLKSSTASRRYVYFKSFENINVLSIIFTFQDNIFCHISTLILAVDIQTRLTTFVNLVWVKPHQMNVKIHKLNTTFVSIFATDYAVWTKTAAQSSFFLLCIINNIILCCHKYNNRTGHALQRGKFHYNVAENKYCMYL